MRLFDRLFIMFMTLGMFVALSCGGTKPPPPPPPPPWECPLDMIGCHELFEIPWCSTPERPCWHNPTEDPEHCEQAPDCEPQPPPPPQECIHEEALEAEPCGGQEYRRKIKAATTALGDVRGKPPQENLEALAAALRDEGLCAIGGREAVFILRSDGLAEENHAVFFGDGGWTGNGFGKFMGCHSGVPPVQCGKPDPLGLPAEFSLNKHNRDWDATYRVYKEHDYCEAAGFVNRMTCPVRPEGNYQREACERRVIGEQKWWCDGEPIESAENPAQARCFGQVKTCTEDGRVCAEAVW